jgi:hypothetical protein
MVGRILEHETDQKKNNLSQVGSQEMEKELEQLANDADVSGAIDIPFGYCRTNDDPP